MSRYVNDQNQSEVIYLALSTVSGVGRRHLSIRCQRYELHFISLRLRNLYSYFNSKSLEMDFSDRVDNENAQEYYQTPSELGVRALQSY